MTCCCNGFSQCEEKPKIHDLQIVCVYCDTALNHLVLDVVIFLIFLSGYFDESRVALMHTMKACGN